MGIVLQILVLVVVLLGLITVIMSVKNWHWAQMLLLLGIFLSSIGTLVLGLEVYRIHSSVRKRIPPIEQQLAALEDENQALREGTMNRALATRIFAEGLPFDWESEGRMPGMSVWLRRLQDTLRQRGRVWRNVAPAGQVDPATGRLPVRIQQPQPHGLEQGAIVYAFEAGEPNAAAPDQGSQYLGEFRVVEVAPDSALLEAIIKLDQRTGNRIVRSLQGGRSRGWSLYETMPADRHDLFAQFSDEELRGLLPQQSVQEYARHGDRATDDDDEHHRAGYDDQGNRVGPDDAGKAVAWRYDRPLRDYAYLFAELARERVILMAKGAALVEDVKKLKEANEIATAFGQLRTQEREALEGDLENIKNDRTAIESLLATIQGQLARAKSLLAERIAENLRLAEQLVAQQTSLLQVIDERAPANPAGSLLLTP